MLEQINATPSTFIKSYNTDDLQDQAYTINEHISYHIAKAFCEKVDTNILVPDVLSCFIDSNNQQFSIELQHIRDIDTKTLAGEKSLDKKLIPALSHSLALSLIVGNPDLNSKNMAFVSNDDTKLWAFDFDRSFRLPVNELAHMIEIMAKAVGNEGFVYLNLLNDISNNYVFRNQLREELNAVFQTPDLETACLAAIDEAYDKMEAVLDDKNILKQRCDAAKEHIKRFLIMAKTQASTLSFPEGRRHLVPGKKTVKFINTDCASQTNEHSQYSQQPLKKRLGFGVKRKASDPVQKRTLRKKTLFSGRKTLKFIDTVQASQTNEHSQYPQKLFVGSSKPEKKRLGLKRQFTGDDRRLTKKCALGSEATKKNLYDSTAFSDRDTQERALPRPNFSLLPKM